MQNSGERCREKEKPYRFVIASAAYWMSRLHGDGGFWRGTPFA